MTTPTRIVVMISADAEWRAIVKRPAPDGFEATPYGACVTEQAAVQGRPFTLVFLHGGWGKIAAAGSTQYAIDRWQPDLVISLGTCGGFAGDIEMGTILLADYTLVYDIMEQMSDPEVALAHYATEIDLSWINGKLPPDVKREMLISADRDIMMGEIQGLRERYGAVAADWESGAIAYVAARNGVRCLILRAVSDVVSPDGGEVYGDPTLFESRTERIMAQLLDLLPSVLDAAYQR